MSTPPFYYRGVSFKNTVTFYLVPGVRPFVLPNVKNREKIAGVDFFKIPVFSKWLLVVIFAIPHRMVNLVLLITPDQIKLEGWEWSHSKGL